MWTEGGVVLGGIEPLLPLPVPPPDPVDGAVPELPLPPGLVVLACCGLPTVIVTVSDEPPESWSPDTTTKAL